ncbi:hypothetical protein CMQ_5167 [Grosmannia clavigera kw1407]|uniref:C2H2-type domain-containing protein n=1 Tax=Grosmannia clavigera (strain kw1407 / UAMH 11150) TaxID=655863 RepID=F0XBU9_GROCL|nr:uncharacterized protein CMQ_5167 [Grosmannia clavigera kw1407]EFX04905.1 hypothetical protein CMQ_5167 [Grosmannia clavigera kw1407]
MATETPSEPRGLTTSGLPPDSLAAARQHIQSLPAHEREALLRALLEQYELQAQPDTAPGPLTLRKELVVRQVPAAVAPPTPPPEICTNTSRSSIDTRASSPLPAASLYSQSPTLVASPQTDESSSPFFSHLRVKSFSQPRRSLSRPESKPRQRSDRHRRTLSLPSEDMPNPTICESGSFLPPPPYTVDDEDSPLADLSAPNPTTETAASAVSDPAASSTTNPSASTARPNTAAASSTRAYWCTSCTRKYQRREDWTHHDEACCRRRRHRAKQAQTQQQQRAWACGFCAAFLGSIDRYHDHVALHFENGKTPAHWHYAHVIYGLLHQPGVHEAWKRLWNVRMAALPARMRTKVYWPPETEARDAQGSRPTLQDSLELFDLAHQSAEVLATRADALAVFVTVPIDEPEPSSTASTSTAAAASSHDNSLTIPGLTLRKSSKGTGAKQPSRKTVAANDPLQNTVRSGRTGLPPAINPLALSPINFARSLSARHTSTYSDGGSGAGLGIGLTPPPTRRRPHHHLHAYSLAEEANFPPTIGEETENLSSDLSSAFP